MSSRPANHGCALAAQRSARTRWLLAPWLAAALVVPSGVHAQRRTPPPQPRTEAAPAEDGTERARELFERGIDALGRERWDEARILFEEAWELAPRPSILVNLGTAQRQSGRLVEARESYRIFLERFATHELAAQTRQSLAEVDELMPQLTVHVEGRQEGDEVFLDEQRIDTLDVAFATNPGLRQVSLWRGGRSLQSVRVRVELEGEEEVFLRAIDLRPDVVVGGGGQGAGAVTPGGDDTGLIVGLVIGAVLVVGAGVTVGVVLGTQDVPRALTAPTIRGGVLTFE